MTLRPPKCVGGIHADEGRVGILGLPKIRTKVVAFNVANRRVVGKIGVQPGSGPQAKGRERLDEVLPLEKILVPPTRQILTNRGASQARAKVQQEVPDETTSVFCNVGIERIQSTRVVMIQPR